MKTKYKEYWRREIPPIKDKVKKMTLKRGIPLDEEPNQNKILKRQSQTSDLKERKAI